MKNKAGKKERKPFSVLWSLYAESLKRVEVFSCSLWKRDYMAALLFRIWRGFSPPFLLHFCFLSLTLFISLASLRLVLFLPASLE